MGFRNRRAPSRPPMGDVIGSEHGHEPILDSQKYKNQLEPHEFFWIAMCIMANGARLESEGLFRAFDARDSWICRHIGLCNRRPGWVAQTSRLVANSSFVWLNSLKYSNDALCGQPSAHRIEIVLIVSWGWTSLTYGLYRRRRFMQMSSMTQSAFTWERWLGPYLNLFT